MSLPEIIPSNLPQFVQNKNRSAFANSVIPSGSVLLFAESDGNGGSKLIAKNPDGSYTEVGGGSSMTFYKCASVGTGTWTGYLASVDPVTGVWSFASTATSGLTYDRLTPVVGNVYDEGCTFRVMDFETDMVDEYTQFYLEGSLTDQSINHIALANNGLTTDSDGYIVGTTNTSYATIAQNTLPNDVLTTNHDWTVEVCFFAPQDYSSMMSGNACLFGNGYYSPPSRFDLMISNTSYNACLGGYGDFSGIVAENSLNYLAVQRSSSGTYKYGLNDTKAQVQMNLGDLRSIDLGVGYSMDAEVNRFLYPFKIKYIRISNCLRLS